MLTPNLTMKQQKKQPQKQKTFMDYTKLSSDEIADEIDAIANGTKSEVF